MWSRFEITIKYQYKFIENPIEIDVKYQWKCNGNSVEILMKHQWKSIEIQLKFNRNFNEIQMK